MWYKAWADVGGSASKCIKEYYFWFSAEMTDDWKDDFWHQYFGRQTMYEDCRPHGTVELVEELPEDIRQGLIESYQNKIHRCEAMLEKLK